MYTILFLTIYLVQTEDNVWSVFQISRLSKHKQFCIDILLKVECSITCQVWSLKLNNFCRYCLSLAHVASLFPGLYSVQAISSFSDMCSVAILRSVNGVLAIVCSVILYDIIMHLKPTLTKRKAMLQAVVLSLYPLHWFFTFLYYTDVAAVTTVLAMYLASLKKNYWFSALVRHILILML